MAGNGKRLDLTPEERQRRRERMRALNAQGRGGRRRTKTDEERIRDSLLEVVRTGSNRQRLDASKQLAELDERARAAGPKRRDFGVMHEEEIEDHLEAMVQRACDAWYAERVLPELRRLYERFGVEHVFDAVVERNAA